MINKIAAENFKNFGHVIHHPARDKHSKDNNLFHVVLKEEGAVGWRIAFLVVRDKSIDKLEQHLETFESFEPVNGNAVLYVAKEKDPKDIQCFYLDKPVILNKGIWHGVVTLDGETEIKITENANVECIYWELGFKLSATHESQRIGEREQITESK